MRDCLDAPWGAHYTAMPTTHTDPLTASPPPTAPTTQEPPSDEEQGAMDSDANFELSFHQEGDYTFLDATVYAAIVELLLELEGVDPEPDFWARSIRGPWHIAVNEDCAQQFKERYGDITTLRRLQMSENTSLVAAALGLAERLA